MTIINFVVLPKTSRGRDFKFGAQMQNGNVSKTREEKFRKGAWPRSRDPQKFWCTPNVCSKRIELETWNLAHRCVGAISQKPAKKNPEKGRGLGHVTPKNFGVHLTYLQNE